jgi:hypothetical protein
MLSPAGPPALSPPIPETLRLVSPGMVTRSVAADGSDAPPCGGRAGGGIAALRSAAYIRLVPIDHGLILPHVSALDEIELAWMGWRQAGEAWSERELAYIAALDGARDAALLASAATAAGGAPLRPECIVTLRACTLLLQRGAAAGLTPREIGGFLVRNGDSPASRMELCVAAARAAAAVAAAAGGAAGGGGGSCGGVGGGEPPASALLDYLEEPLAAHIAAVLAARESASRTRSRTVT